MNVLTTRLTEKFGLKYPVFSAPMAFASGGKLAAAVTNAGGLGLIGGAYGDQQWIENEFQAAGNIGVGCGVITWAMKDKPEVVDQILDHKPKALFLSFGDPKDFIEKAHKKDVPVICQVQTFKDAKHAIHCGAEVIVAQGAEAGGHGESRSTFTLVPEVADYICGNAPETLLCAAGGIADGRGLAAALMLGADGVLIGSRFWASEEAIVHSKMLDAALVASGDETIRSSVMDIARRLNWPERYTARVLKNGFTHQWHHDLDGLLENQDEQADLWRAAWQEGNTDVANTFVGEAAGLINSIEPAAKILTSIADEAERLLGRK